jgi:cysteinyl-tRNA synthetase
MDNDFNTAQAQGIFFDTAKIINRLRRSLGDNPLLADINLLKDSVRKLKELAYIMGLLREDAALFLQSKKDMMLAQCDIDAATIEKLIAERLECRKEKNWARGDEIRDELLAKNIELKDGPEGTAWVVKSSA